MGRTAPGAHAGPPGEHDLDWLPAVVPGTVASSLAALGREPGPGDDLDAEDWWFRTELDPARAEGVGPLTLAFEGVATVWEAFLGGEPLASGDSMYAPVTVDLEGRLEGPAELFLCCRSLGPLLEERRQPRARWRTKVAAPNLRFFRATLHGRAPGFSPGPAPVGPWRGVTLRRGDPPAWEVRPRVEGTDGVLAVRGERDGDRVELETGGGVVEAALEPGEWVELRVPEVPLWWPHTHGEPACHELRLVRDGRVAGRRRVGFRTLESAGDADVDGIDLRINGVPVFARGAVWTPVDALGLAPAQDELRAALLQVRDAGMNMVRVPGTGVYESRAFHDGCDEFGLLVWQDLMFANFDYPVGDEAFRAEVEAEVRRELAGVAGRPSLAVVCGNSEVEQQASMFGRPPEMGRGPLFGELIPALLEETGADAAYVPSAPCGGDLPFRPGVGVANYFGVGGYRRPLGDARAAGVRFASECLAFANLGDGAGADAAAPRDVGSEWDFADVRDHYLETVFGREPAALRAEDPSRYAALSRAVSGHVMAETFGEWRRGASPCRGALVLCLRDVVEGAGWGLVERGGAAKEALLRLGRVLAPTAIWTTDEGLGGIDVHVANDGPHPLAARVRVALYRDFGQLVEESETEVTVDAHGGWTASAESVLGGFRDVSWAYRFGAPGQDVVVATLEGDDPRRPLSQAVRYPVGVPSEVETAAELGLRATVVPGTDGPAVLSLRSDRLVWGLRVAVEEGAAAEDAFDLEPGHERHVTLRGGAGVQVQLTALNLAGALEAGRS